MKELTIIKRGDAAYIDSREVAEAIGKPHKNLIRDIRGYIAIIEKTNRLNFEPVDFFVESAYRDSKGEARVCYLISKMGCELCAHKLIGEKGVLFTAAYVKRFNELETKEREELKAQAATPRLKVFNTAVRNVLAGYGETCASSEEIMSFLKGAYKPFGIEVAPVSAKHLYTVTEIACYLSMFSESGLYHGHAVSAIIEKLNIAPEHIAISPYGAVGITTRYDGFVVSAVEDWIVDNDFPHDIPHLNFEYHVYYDLDRYEKLYLYSPSDRKDKYGLGYFDDDTDWLDDISDWFGDGGE